MSLLLQVLDTYWWVSLLMHNKANKSEKKNKPRCNFCSSPLYEPVQKPLWPHGTIFYCKLTFSTSYYPAAAAVRDVVAMNTPKLKEKGLFQNLLLYLRKQPKRLKIFFWREKPFPARDSTLSTGENTRRGACIASPGDHSMSRGFSLTKPGVEMLLDLLHPEKSRVWHLQSVLFIWFISETKREAKATVGACLEHTCVTKVWDRLSQQSGNS